MKHVVSILLILNFFLLPCGCLSAALLLFPSIGGEFGFTTDIHVTNETEEVLRVTPIGAVGPEGTRAPLPSLRAAPPAPWPANPGGFDVGPGETLTLLYDWDDINLAEIVIENAQNEVRQIVADPQPTVNQYRPPSPNAFTVSDFEALKPVPPDTLAAFERAKDSPSLSLIAWLFLLPWLTFVLLLVGLVVQINRSNSPAANEDRS